MTLQKHIKPIQSSKTRRDLSAVLTQNTMGLQYQERSSRLFINFDNRDFLREALRL